MKKTTDLTKIKSSLPYCLYHIDDRFFKMNNGKDKIQFTKEPLIPNRRTAEMVGMETIRDRWGIDAYSKVFIITERQFKDESDAKKHTLRLVNKFITIHRHFDETAVHLIPLISEDLSEFIWEASGKGVAILGLSGGIAISNPLLIQVVSSKIDGFFREDLKLQLLEELLLNAEQYIYQGQFRQATIETAIALELVVQKFITGVCEEKKIKSGYIQDYIKDVGIYSQLNILLRLLINDNFMDEILEKCKTGVNIRNNVIHKAGTADENQAKDFLYAVRELIKVISSNKPINSPIEVLEDITSDAQDFITRVQ